jgi:hypothetical protein
MQIGSGIAMGSPSNGGIALVRITASRSAIQGVIPLRELKCQKRMLVPFIIHSTSEQKVKRFLIALDVFIKLVVIEE